MPERAKAMTANQFNSALRKLDLSVYASAKILGISLRQAQRYSAGETDIPAVIAKLLDLLVRHGIPDQWRA